MNKNGKKSLGIVFLLISFALIGAGVYLSIFNTKNIMLKFISTEFETLYNSNEKKKVKYKDVTTGSMELVNKTQTQRIEFNSSIYSDQQNNKFLFEGGITGLDYGLDSLKIFLEQNKLYFKLSESSPLQYLEFVEDKDSMFPSAEIEEIKNILKKELVSNLPDKNFNKSKENITLNANNLETEKYVMKVNMVDFYNILSNSFLKIRANKDIKKINEVITNGLTSAKTTDDLVLQEMKTDLLGKNSENSNKILFEYCIYTLKDKVIKHELKFEDAVFTFGKYEKETGIFDYEILLKDEEETLLTMTIIGSKNSSKINIKMDSLILEGEKVINESKETLNLKAYVDSSKTTELASINYEKLTEANNNFSETLNAKINVYEDSYYNISVTNSYSENVEVPAFDVTGATKFNLGEQFSTIPISTNVLTSYVSPTTLLAMTGVSVSLATTVMNKLDHTVYYNG